MISSTRADLAQYREEASRVIKSVAAEKEQRVQLVELSMEKETQSGNREFAVAVSKRWVEESDWVVVIVGWNYGTISDEEGADGLSVTEWEYRHASKLRKKLFVFMAGEPRTANQYRWSAEEKEDLKDWISTQQKEQAEKLENFKHDLGKRHADMFTNLQAFRERLEKTLKNAIDDLPPEIQPGTPLAELIVAVRPNIHDCIRKVNLTANCKRIHDYLHELRQRVIRPLREEVLSVWKQEGTLSESRERVIWRCMNKMSGAVGGIREVRQLIGPDHQGLRDSVDAVLQLPDLWNIESDSPEARPGRDDFTEAVDDLAGWVQAAFSEADRSMAREESDLRERYLKLLEDLKRARQQRKLGFSDQQRLDDELEKIDANRERVKNSLTSHHNWQEAHDELEELDSLRESGVFERRLNHYRRTPLAKLLSLVDHELGRAEAHQAGTAATEAAVVAAAAQQAPPQAPSDQHTCDAFASDLRRLKGSLEALRQSADVIFFDKMRKPFDDAFYYLDKTTLSEVERAQERVVKLEDWLDGLAAAQKKTV
jgi:hypothetical protein